MDKTDRYTLAEFAARLCGGAEERAAYQTARRIQNWVTAGLLRPRGEVHGGRGVHRRYDRHELGKAAVLLELHRYQLPVRMLEIAAGVFDDARERDEQLAQFTAGRVTPGQRRQRQKLARLLRSAWQQKRPIFLSLGQDAAGEIRAEFGPAGHLDPAARSQVVVNLTAVLSGLAEGDVS